MTVVRVDDLRKAASVLLDHLQETHGTSIELDNDYFWSIPFDSLYEVSARPTDLTIGQLSETSEFLASVTSGDDPLNYGLVWLGDLLRSIGGQAEA